MKIMDISRPYYAGMPVYPGDPDFQSQYVCAFVQGDGCEVSKLTLGTHCGTHIDAPAHMIPGGCTIDHLGIERFYGPCRVVTVGPGAVTAHMLEMARVETGERLLLKTEPEALHRIAADSGSITQDAADYLVSRKTVLVGIDSDSIEDMDTGKGEVHRSLLGAGIPIIEGLDLSAVPDGRYILSAFPLLLRGENGSPCRAVLICE